MYDPNEKQDRDSLFYQLGQIARQNGALKDKNPLRYIAGKSSPDHPDIWEAQWDLGWEEAAIFEGKGISFIPPDTMMAFTFKISYCFRSPEDNSLIDIEQTRTIVASNSDQAFNYLQYSYTHERVTQLRIHNPEVRRVSALISD